MSNIYRIKTKLVKLRSARKMTLSTNNVVYWPPVRAVWLNDEVAEIQPWSVTTLNLVSIAYCYIEIFISPLSVPLTVSLPSEGDSASCPVRKHCSSPLHAVSSAHLGVPNLCPSIPIPHRLSTGSSTHAKQWLRPM